MLPDLLLAAVDLVRARKEHPEQEVYDLLALPGEHRQVAPIDLRASLHEARQVMTETGTDTLLVISRTVPGVPRIYGVVTRDDIEKTYRY